MQVEEMEEEPIEAIEEEPVSEIKQPNNKDDPDKKIRKPIATAIAIIIIVAAIASAVILIDTPDPDSDGDGVLDVDDALPEDSDESENADGNDTDDNEEPESDEVIDDIVTPLANNTVTLYESVKTLIPIYAENGTEIDFYLFANTTRTKHWVEIDLPIGYTNRISIEYVKNIYSNDSSRSDEVLLIITADSSFVLNRSNIIEVMRIFILVK